MISLLFSAALPAVHRAEMGLAGRIVHNPRGGRSPPRRQATIAVSRDPAGVRRQS
jgi:hypothetical protein